MSDKSIEARVARSSLGTPAATAARRTVTTATAARLVARAAASPQRVNRSRQGPGG